MFKSLKNYLKKNIAGMGLSAIAVISISIVFGLYINFIGYPMTQAKNELNKGILAFNSGNWEEAGRHFRHSLDFWNTLEARNYLSLTDNKLQK